MTIADPTQRFTSRAESYRDYRPRYPEAVVGLLHRACGLSIEDCVVDIAAGTGLLAEIFLAAGHLVLAVEPNDAMRQACLELQPSYPNLSCIPGTAEASHLPDACAQLVTVGQALHWFDFDRARAEFARILKPGGWCAIVYNDRRVSGDPFHDGYEQILRSFGTDYELVRHSHAGPEKIAAFFHPSAVQTATLPNHQDLTRDGLLGRILSSSYMPQPGHPRYNEMTAAIEELFARNQHNGHVRLDYQTAISYGPLIDR